MFTCVGGVFCVSFCVFQPPQPPTNKNTDKKAKKTIHKIDTAEKRNIYRIEKNAGNTVDEGDVMLILESMKMEIEILAEKKGIIKSFLVEEGDLVQEGQHLADIETS